MDCHAHAEVPAVANCAGCAEPLCGNCLVEVKGAQYCGSCKTMAFSGTAAPILHESKDAKDALTMALVGIVCFGIILEPIAIVKALKARSAIAADPNLGGKGKATAALVIASVMLVLNVLFLVSKIAGVQ